MNIREAVVEVRSATMVVSAEIHGEGLLKMVQVVSLHLLLWLIVSVFIPILIILLLVENSLMELLLIKGRVFVDLLVFSFTLSFNLLQLFWVA